MSAPEHSLPPIPRELAEEVRALRQLQPSEALIDRALAALPERPEPTSVLKGDKAPPRRSFASSWGIWGGLAVGAAVAAAVAIAGPWWSDPPRQAQLIERSEERSMDLPEEGHAWTDLDIWTHHHEAQPAIVRVEVPEHVRVRLPGEDGGSLERHCEETRCVHRFTHREGVRVPLRVAVAQPGRYEINIRHESREARVSETFVLTAMREEVDDAGEAVEPD